MEFGHRSKSRLDLPLFHPLLFTLRLLFYHPVLTMLYLLTDSHKSLPIGFAKALNKASLCVSVLVVNLQNVLSGSVGHVKRDHVGH